MASMSKPIRGFLVCQLSGLRFLPRPCNNRDRLRRQAWPHRGAYAQQQRGVIDMKVMVIVKASKESEAGAMPDEEVLTQMGQFNEELVKAGILLAMEGLHPSAKGVRVKFP